MKAFWNERYSDAEYAYGIRPNVFLQSFLDTHPAGLLLMPAEGEGRNAVYAARKGWQVTAFDYSEAGRKKALALAAQHGVNIEYRLSDIGSFPFEVNYYDAVGLCFVHLPPELRLHLHQHVTTCLKPGGKVVLEAFAKQQMRFTSGGPRNEVMLYSAEELKSDFSALHILHLHEEEVRLNEGKYHRGPAGVVRMIAQKIA